MNEVEEPQNDESIITQKVAKAFANGKGIYTNMDDYFAKYEEYVESGNNEPNIRVDLGGRRGFHGGAFFFYCTNSQGQPFFFVDRTSETDYPSLESYSNDELYPYFPHDRADYERIKEQYKVEESAEKTSKWGNIFSKIKNESVDRKISKKTIRLTESDLHRIIKESANKVLKNA